MGNKIQSHCDTRCQYANPDNVECDCECGGKNHGQGTDTRIWEIKTARLSKTRKAFRKQLNAEKKGSGTKLYRKNRTEFDRLYLLWKNGQDETVTVHSAGMDKDAEITIIKDAEFNGDTYSHIRRVKTGKTEYRKNGKLITKGQVPTELGW